MKPTFANFSNARPPKSALGIIYLDGLEGGQLNSQVISTRPASTSTRSKQGGIAFLHRVGKYLRQEPETFRAVPAGFREFSLCRAGFSTTEGGFVGFPLPRPPCPFFMILVRRARIPTCISPPLVMIRQAYCKIRSSLLSAASAG
jgi:hypothetical protein